VLDRTLHVCVCVFNCIYVMCCLAGVINDDSTAAGGHR